MSKTTCTVKDYKAVNKAISDMISTGTKLKGYALDVFTATGWKRPASTAKGYKTFDKKLDNLWTVYAKCKVFASFQKARMAKGKEPDDKQDSTYPRQYKARFKKYIYEAMEYDTPKPVKKEPTSVTIKFESDDLQADIYDALEVLAKINSDAVIEATRSLLDKID